MKILGRYLLTDDDLWRIRTEEAKFTIEYVRRGLILTDEPVPRHVYRWLGDYEYALLQDLRKAAGRWT